MDPDGEVKFEMSEMEQDIVEEVATSSNLHIVDDGHEEEAGGGTVQAASSSAMGRSSKLQPKKRNSTVVSKCNRCNGTGLIYMESGEQCNSGLPHNQSSMASGGGGGLGGGAGAGVCGSSAATGVVSVPKVTVKKEKGISNADDFDSGIMAPPMSNDSNLK